jgi:hypothetical protein
MNQVIYRLNINTSRLIEYEKISGKGVKYRLLRDIYIQTGILPSKNLELGCIRLSLGGFLLLRAGYEWNGGNFILDTFSVMRGSIFHDALCELYERGLLNKTQIKQFNDLFSYVCSEDGAPRWRVVTHRFILRIRWQDIF